MIRKLTFTLLAVFIHQVFYAQTMTYLYEENNSYCTFEIDTTLAVPLGTYRAFQYLDVPYYEMTFRPKFEYTAEGQHILVITPTFHYQAYLEKVYGEVEATNKEEYQRFELKFEISPDNNTLTYISTDEEKQFVFNRSSFSKKARIIFTEFPLTFTKNSKVNFDKFPKGLRNNLQKRMNKIKSRLSN